MTSVILVQQGGHCGITSPSAVLAIQLASSEEAHVRVNGSADVLAVLPLNAASNPGPKAMLQVYQLEPHYKVLGAGKDTSRPLVTLTLRSCVRCNFRFFSVLK